MRPDRGFRDFVAAHLFILLRVRARDNEFPVRGRREHPGRAAEHRGVLAFATLCAPKRPATRPVNGDELAEAPRGQAIDRLTNKDGRAHEHWRLIVCPGRLADPLAMLEL